MKKFFPAILIFLTSLILFSCTNLIMGNEDYGSLTLTMPASFVSEHSVQARAAENVDSDSMEFKIVLTNIENETQRTETAALQEKISFELVPGLYNIKLSAYNPSAPDDILYEGETTNIEVTAGKITQTTVSLKRTPDDGVIGRDGTIRLSKITDSVVLKTNVWGEKDYSDFQTDTIDLTKYFNGKLPAAGQTLKIYYKGKINIDASKLYVGLVDIKKYEDGHEEWNSIVSDEKIHTPVATNIKANQEFEINVSFTLETDVKHTLQLVFCCGAEGRIFPGFELVGNVVKVNPPDESYLSVLKSMGCDGYYIGIASGKTPEGWDRWICGRKFHLTDKNVFSDVDFGMDIDESLIENGKIYPVIDFYQNVDLEAGERTWLAKVVGSEKTYVMDSGYSPAVLTIESGILKITPPGTKIMNSMIEKGCDGYIVGIVSGKNGDGNDNWICGDIVLLTDENAFEDIDFSQKFAEQMDVIVNNNGEFAAIIDFYKDVEAGEGEREFLGQYKSEIYRKHLFAYNVADGIQVTLCKYENDPAWSYSLLKLKEDGEDLGIQYSYYYNGACVLDSTDGPYSFLFPFTTEGKEYTFTINPFEECSETVTLVANNTTEIQLQNLSELEGFEVTYTEEDDSRTVSINMNPLNIFSNPDKLEYINLCVNAYTPDYGWLYNFQNIDVLMDGFNIMEDDVWSNFKTRLQGYDKIIFSSNVEFSVENHFGGDRGAYLINLGSVTADWTQPAPAVVTFETNDGTPVEDMEIPDGEYIHYYWYISGTENYGRTTYFVDSSAKNYYSMIPVPTMEGKVFYGWYLDSELSTEATTSFPVNGSKTLYAKWVEPCTINFVTDCDTSIPSITVPSGRDYYFHINGTFAYEMRIDGNSCIYRLSNTDPNYPKKEGCTLKGWYMDSGFTIPAFEQDRKFNASANGTITLYAKWE